MNPEGTSNLNLHVFLSSPPQYPAPDFCPCSPPSSTFNTGPQAVSSQAHNLGGQTLKINLTGSDLQSTLQTSPANESPAPPHCIVSISSSPDVRPSPDHPRPVEDAGLDLECSICFCQFNNIFRCPKMLQCKHTFCLECLARINVKSAEPDAIQCPLCRRLTRLPILGLPKLATDSDVLSYLPTAMQRVYSIRFLRNKGRLQVKRSREGQLRLGQRAGGHSLDVGLPSPPATSGTEAGGCLFRLTSQPACRAFLLTTVVLMLVVLTGIIIFIITFKDDEQQLFHCCG